jgi:hypothetical protein
VKPFSKYEIPSNVSERVARQTIGAASTESATAARGTSNPFVFRQQLHVTLSEIGKIAHTFGVALTGRIKPEFRAKATIFVRDLLQNRFFAVWSDAAG